MDALRKLIFFAALGIACGSDETTAPESPCKAFAKEPQPALVTTVLAAEPARRAFLVRDERVVTFAGHELREKGRALLDLALPDDAILDVVVARDGARAFVLYQGTTGSTDEYRVVRFSSEDGGATFGPAKDMIEVTIGPASPGVVHPGALALHEDGTLFVALGDVVPSEAQNPSSLLGKVLRLDVSGDRAAPVPGVPPTVPRREVWGLGVAAPLGLSVDSDAGDVWLLDRRGAVDELHRILPRRNYGHPSRALEGDFALPVATLDGSRKVAAPGAVVRGSVLGALSGSYVVASSAGLVAVSPHGPSGTAEIVELGEPTVGRVEPGSTRRFFVAGAALVSVEGAPSTIPQSLAETGCWDFTSPNGAPRGAIAYDVSAPLWSDGADKSRFVVLPPDARGRAREDGDIELPVGAVAVKTFSIGGRKIETRLLVQHERDDWVGYSYAWNDQGTDATLVSGNRLIDVGGGQKWYFPSRTDCTACHTAAAAFTLGIEARQTGAAPFAEHVDGLADAPRFDAKDARAYLHANCSGCHRGGSVTGDADLDLRFDTPLAETGLCAEPKVSTLGIAGARIVAPGDPERSVLVRRMKALDETRMPKLATRVVDVEGVTTVEGWVRSLGSCP